jgi:hypothetical protein
MELSINGTAVVFYDIDTGEPFMPDGPGRKALKVPRMAVIQ